MDFIDFDTPKQCNKLSSPLIPLPEIKPIPTYIPRLSIANDNPFDLMLRKSVLVPGDPFEVLKSPVVHGMNEENKENLISPFKTTPFRERNDCLLKVNNLMLNKSMDANESSLQCLHDSVLDNTVFDLNRSEHVPVFTSNSPSRIEKNSSSSVLNKAFLDATTMLSLLKLSSGSVNTPNLSNILPGSVSTINSTEAQDSDALNCAFLKNTDEGFVDIMKRNCKSANCEPVTNCSNLPISPPPPPTTTKKNLKSRKIHNSFGGFDYKERKPSYNEQIENSVFLEASYLSKYFSKAVHNKSEYMDEELSTIYPPWLEEDYIIVNEQIDVNIDEYLKENLENTNIKNGIDKPSESIPVNDTTQTYTFDKTPSEDTDMKNATNLLNNLTQILRSDGQIVNKRKLGENLINSLALALSLKSPDKKLNESIKSEDEEEAKEIEEPNEEPECKEIIIPKIKTKTIAPIKSVKLRNEKEKIGTKGPLKAIIPLKNMAPNEKNINPSISIQPTTPDKSSENSFLYHQKKHTSTPNELKLNPPIAQSTPSTLPRPSKSFNINDASMSSSKSGNSSYGGDKSVNHQRSLPFNVSDSKSMARRKSSSDIKTNAPHNRSFEHVKKATVSQLKRSFSFQNKNVTKTQNTPEKNLRRSTGSESKLQVNSSLRKSGGFGSKLKSLMPKTNK